MYVFFIKLYKRNLLCQGEENPVFFFMLINLPLLRSFPHWKILLMLSKVKKKLLFDGCLVGCVKGICNLCLVPSQQMSNTAVINWHSRWQPLQRGQMEADLFSDFISGSAEQASQCEEVNTGSYWHC